MAIDVRPLQPVPSDRAWAAGVLRASWGGTEILSRGRSHDAATLPGLVAELDGDPVGLATYAIEEGQCELVTLDSLAPRRGVGGALLDGVVLAAREAGCARVWLVTTNDNLAALRFYQRRGFDLVAVYRDAVTRARHAKPEIPEVGLDGIPLRHELELERRPE